MCDYSLENVASRPAEAGEKLISTRFPNAMSKGFTSPKDPTTAVCLRPGTEVAFETDVHYARNSIENAVIPARVATFVQIDKEVKHSHHDALQFVDGTIIRLAYLIPGQIATVVQLPIDTVVKKLDGGPKIALHEGGFDQPVLEHV